MLCASWLDLSAESPDHRYLCCELTDYADDQPELAAFAASEILYALSGEQYPGRCEAVIRPCSGDGCTVQWVAYGRGGSRPLVATCGCGMDLGCAGCGANGIVLPGGPIVSVDEVKINGDVIPESGYRLSGRVLIRVGGSWPRNQDLALPDTEERTFSIAYTYGNRPGPSGLFAVADLTCELLKGCDDSDDCSLPENVRSMLYEGATFELDPASLLGDDGKTGLKRVDRWLESVNPNRLARAGKVLSPALLDATYL